MELQSDQDFLGQFESDLEQKLNQDFSKKFTENQFFQILYDGNTFYVEPMSLCNSSHRFHDIIKPYIQDNERLKSVHLEIYGNQFTKRNMNNFLRICQNLPTDVQNWELKEICEIAKMFKAEAIYSIGVKFIRRNLDPNFTIAENKYDSYKNTMSIVKDDKGIEIDFQSTEICLEDIQNESYNSANHQINHDVNIYTSLNQTTNHSDNSIDEKQGKNKSSSKKKKSNSVIYSVQIENNLFKGKTFKFVHDNRILYVAKKKFNEIFIVEGCEINLRNSNNHVGYILQNSSGTFNTIKAYDAHFDLNYIKSEITDEISINVSFPSYDQIFSWFPKPLKHRNDSDQFYLNYQGQHKHKPIRSSKNLILQNDAGHPTFIVRQMAKNLFEFECNHNVDPLIAFTIGISDVIGPYKDLWSNASSLID